MTPIIIKLLFTDKIELFLISLFNTYVTSKNHCRPTIPPHKQKGILHQHRISTRPPHLNLLLRLNNRAANLSKIIRPPHLHPRLKERQSFLLPLILLNKIASTANIQQKDRYRLSLSLHRIAGG